MKNNEETRQMSIMSIFDATNVECLPELDELKNKTDDLSLEADAKTASDQSQEMSGKSSAKAVKANNDLKDTSSKPMAAQIDAINSSNQHLTERKRKFNKSSLEPTVDRTDGSKSSDAQLLMPSEDLLQDTGERDKPVATFDDSEIESTKRTLPTSSVAKAHRDTKTVPQTAHDFEAALAELEKIVMALDSEVKLEQALELFEEGMKLSSKCEQFLKVAEQKIELLKRVSDGTLSVEPFKTGHLDISDS